MKKFAAVLCMLLLFTMACTGSQIIGAIEAALAVATAAFPIVSSAAGLQPAQQAAIMQYLQDANAALNQVSQIVTTGGTQAEVAAKITAALSAIVANEPNLQGLPASVANIVKQVADSLANILSQYGGKKTLTAGEAAKPVKPEGKDVDRLAACQQKAQANQAKIKAFLASHK